MFHLLVSGAGWKTARDTMPCGRTLEYTSDQVKEVFVRGDTLNLDEVLKIPALFASETLSDNSQAPARIGRITRATKVGRDYLLEYYFEPDMPSVANSTIIRLAHELGVHASGGFDELSRTHWSIKDADLFRVLLAGGVGNRPRSRVFSLTESEQDARLVAVMMPFAAEFNPVYEALRSAADAAGMHCQRADDIWINEHIIQDVVTLLCTASIVVCDITGRNPNVFYELGIAHLLGRDVIMVTQDSGRVPFDVAHIRHLQYQLSGKGLRQLGLDIQRRFEALRNRT